jgi:hypothetical protein
MKDSREDTQSELKFKELLQELRDLKLYDLCDRVSETFYTNSMERFQAGLDTASKIYQKNQ